MEQLPLDIGRRLGVTLDDFIPGDNQQLLQQLRDLPASSSPQQIYVSGASGTGKSHLMMGVATQAHGNDQCSAYLPLRDRDGISPTITEGMEQCDLLIVEDVQSIASSPEWELALFNLFNRAKEAGCHMLFTADCGVSSLCMTLPDLQSRLAWGLSYQLFPLNDEDKTSFLIRQAKTRGLALEPPAAEFLLARYARDTRSLVEIFNELDRASLATKRKLTIPFIREHLHNRSQ